MVRESVPARGRRRWVLRGLLAGAALLLVLAAVLALQARSAYAHLNAASAQVPVLRAELTEGDQRGARATAEELADDTGAAYRAIHGPHWSVVAALPWVGPNVEAVQTVSASIHRVAARALPDLVEVADVLAPASMAPQRGRVALAPLQEAGARVRSASGEVAAAERQLTSIQGDALHPRVRDRVDAVTTTVSALEEVVGAASTVVELLPPMLGAEGRRHYLLLAQNNAEPRALGGIPGAVILLRADRGRISILEQRTAAELASARPAVRLSPAEKALFGSQLGRFMQNVTATPDFPRAAEIAHALWRRGGGRPLDGVAAVDPVALQILLGATGPVGLPDGAVLDGRNTARLLLNQVYLDHPDPAVQDLYFVRAAQAVLGEVMSGSGDLRETAEAFVEATAQRRILLWSRHEEEQGQLAGTTIAGSLTGRDGSQPVVGVYLHDRTAGKIGYYQRVEATARATCDADGARDLRLTVRLTSEVPKGFRLPAYVTGTGDEVQPGHIRTEVLIYAPDGGLIGDARASAGENRLRTFRHAGLHVVSREVSLAPGETVTLEYDLTVPAGLDGDVRLRMTPGPGAGRFSGSASGCD